MAPDRRVLLANSVYHLTNDAAVVVMAGQITVLRDVFRFGYQGAGLLTAVALLVTIIFQIIFGHLSDRRDPSRFLTVAIAYLGMATIAVAFASEFSGLLVLIAVARVGSSAYHPVGISWIGRSYSGPALDHAMGFQSSFGDLGVILGMGTGAILGSAVGWWAPFVAWGALNLVAVGFAITILHGQPSRAPAGPRRPVNYASLIRDVRYWLLPIAIGGAVFNLIVTFGPQLVKDRFGGTDALAGVSIALWILAGSIAAFFFGRVSRRFGRYRSLLAAYAALALACLAAAAGGALVALPLLWTLGSALFITYPATFSFVSEASHGRVMGAAFGVIFAFQLAGGAIAVYIAGALAERLGGDPDVPFLLGAAVCASGLAYLLAIRARADTGRRATAVAAPQL